VDRARVEAARVREEERIALGEHDALLSRGENDRAPALAARDGEREVTVTYPPVPIPPESGHTHPISGRGPRIPGGRFVPVWNSGPTDRPQAVSATAYENTVTGCSVVISRGDVPSDGLIFKATPPLDKSQASRHVPSTT
jgi:hypothetical protein